MCITDKTLHLFIRLSAANDASCLVLLDPIEGHNEVVKRCGEVLFGWAGRSPSATSIAILRDNIESRKDVRLVVGRKAGKLLKYFAAPMLAVSNSHKGREELVPEYYREISGSIQMWLLIREFARADEAFLSRLVLWSNRRHLIEVAPTCRTPFMLVAEETE